MFKKNKLLFKKYSKYIDSNIFLQALVGLASIVCAVLVWVFDRSLSTLFDVLKDIFGTIMVFVVLAVAVSHFKDRFATKKEKFDYIDFWDENEPDIYGEDISLFLRPLIYGLQAATYLSDETERLYNHLNKILEEKKYNSATSGGIINMAKAILEIFIKTERLTEPLKEEDFIQIEKVLILNCEKELEDKEFAAWCEIFRNDKLELAYERYAAGLVGNEKVRYLTMALDKCRSCIELINQQVQRNPEDKNYALLYLSYLNRNTAQIYNELYKVSEDEKDFIKSKDFIKITYNIRKQLLEYFQKVRKTNTVTSDYITQEYVLSLGEQYALESDPKSKEVFGKEIHEYYDKWKLRSKTRTMLFNKISEIIEQVEIKKE